MTDDTENSKKPGKPFLPGQSGNKGGRPRDVDGLRALIREHGPGLAKELIEIAAGRATRTGITALGNEVEIGPTMTERIKATEVLFSYWVGKPSQAIELTGANGDPLGIAEARDAARELLIDPVARAALRAALRGEEATTVEAVPVATGSTSSTAMVGVAQLVEPKHAAGSNPAAHIAEWFRCVLARYLRVAIAGGPKTGKTTLANLVPGKRFHGDDHIGKGWSEASEALAVEVNDYTLPLVVEGVQVPRALRKGMRVDAVIWLEQPHVKLTKEQATMAKGVATVFAEWRADFPHVPVLVPPV